MKLTARQLLISLELHVFHCDIITEHSIHDRNLLINKGYITTTKTGYKITINGELYINSLTK